MTLEELNDHRNLVVKLDETEKLKKQLFAKAYPGAQNLDGMPRGADVSDKVGFLAAEIADLETDIDDLKRQIDSSKPRVIEFINSIDDPSTKLLFRLYFLRGMLWKEVADLVGDYRTEASVSSACYRYMRTHCDGQSIEPQEGEPKSRTETDENRK